jgi:hypothetical protein
MRNRILFLLAAVFMLAQQYTSAQVTGQYPVMMTNKNNGYEFGVGKLPVEAGDTLGKFQMRGWVTDGFYHPGVQIQSYINGPVSADGFAADMMFSTGFPSLTSRMVITANGRVGIGTNTPDFDLHTVGNTHTTGDFYGRIHFDDNRFTDDAPDSYIDEAYFELKQRSVLDLPLGPGTHGGLLSLAPGTDSYDHQLFFAEDGIFTRRHTGNAPDWTGANWYKMLTSEDINGTPNQIAKFTGPSSLGDSQLFDDGTQVGIGTTTPSAGFFLDVIGNTRIAGNLDVTNELEVGSNATIGQSLLVNQNTAITGTLDVGSTADIIGNTTVGGILTVNNHSALNGTLDVSGNTDVNGLLTVNNDANIAGVTAIGTTSTPGSHQLYVGGSIIAEEVVVKLEANWPDYVFASDYQLPTLEEVENHIREKGHLPGIPSAAEVEAQGGVELGEMQRLMMEKIEALTLYAIEADKRNEALQAQLIQLQARLEMLEKE